MPGQQRGWCDQPVPVQLAGQQPGQRGEDRLVWPGGPWPAHLATQHRHLVPQCQQLGSDRRLAVGQDREPPEQTYHDQIEKSKTHDQRVCPSTTLL